MPYYLTLSKDIKGLFGPGATKQSVIAALKRDGMQKGADFAGLGIHKDRRSQSWTFASSHALLLGTDKHSRGDLVDAVGDYFDFVDDIEAVPAKPKEWVACVSFVDSETAPTFLVIALVNSGALAAAGAGWKEEDSPKAPWTTHAADLVGQKKKVFELKRVDAKGKWK